MASPLLDVQSLTVTYSAPPGSITAVRDVSFQLETGKTLAIVGETGSGKSTIALALMGLLEGAGRVDSGEIRFESQNLLGFTESQWRKHRGNKMGILFQDARGALNPVLTVGAHLVETLRAHQRISRRLARSRALALLADVGIPDPQFSMRRYPFELSGGMCQRIGIALGICNAPRLLIGDEPTSALDPSIQVQIVELLREMQCRHGLALLLISHDLGLVAEVADHVAVMYHGNFLEYGSVTELFPHPAHPYGQALVECVPDLNHQHREKPLRTIEGMLPTPNQDLPGCPFAPRCSVAEPICSQGMPAPVRLSDSHWAACIKV
jgi:oligopeptide/dipeptide ABC transporter ATP-binding protein